jgi:hypothetical protein
VSPVRYELGFYIPEDGILRSHRRENLESHKVVDVAIFSSLLAFKRRNAAGRVGAKSAQSGPSAFCSPNGVLLSFSHLFHSFLLFEKSAWSPLYTFPLIVKPFTSLAACKLQTGGTCASVGPSKEGPAGSGTRSGLRHRLRHRYSCEAPPQMRLPPLPSCEPLHSASELDSTPLNARNVDGIHRLAYDPRIHYRIHKSIVPIPAGPDESTPHHHTVYLWITCVCVARGSSH